MHRSYERISGWGKSCYALCDQGGVKWEETNVCKAMGVLQDTSTTSREKYDAVLLIIALRISNPQIKEDTCPAQMQLIYHYAGLLHSLQEEFEPKGGLLSSFLQKEVLDPEKVRFFKIWKDESLEFPRNDRERHLIKYMRNFFSSLFGDIEGVCDDCQFKLMKGSSNKGADIFGVAAMVQSNCTLISRHGLWMNVVNTFGNADLCTRDGEARPGENALKSMGGTLLLLTDDQMNTPNWELLSNLPYPDGCPLKPSEVGSILELIKSLLKK